MNPDLFGKRVWGVVEAGQRGHHMRKGGRWGGDLDRRAGVGNGISRTSETYRHNERHRCESGSYNTKGPEFGRLSSRLTLPGCNASSSSGCTVAS